MKQITYFNLFIYDAILQILKDASVTRASYSALTEISVIFETMHNYNKINKSESFRGLQIVQR